MISRRNASIFPAGVNVEFASAAPEKSRDIDLKSFVPVTAIPPSFYERPYFLAPDEHVPGRPSQVEKL